MSLTDFFHGVETVTVKKGARTVQTIRTSVIGLIGTAPLADPIRFPYNTPVLCNRRSDMQGLGATGTLPVSLDAIYDQIGALVVVIRVPHFAEANQQLAALIGGVDNVTGALTGVHAFRRAESDLGVAPMLLVAPGFTHLRPNGVAEIEMTDEGEDYTFANVVFTGHGGVTSPVGEAILSEGKIVGVRLSKPGFDLKNTPDIAFEGDGSGATARAVMGNAANPLVGELLGVALGMRAHIIADGPSTTDAAAYQYRKDWGDRRIFILDPRVLGWSETDQEYVLQSGSARIAGHIARVDNEFGYWESPSNKEVVGIGGIERPIDYADGSKTSRANLLNEQCIATFIRDNGWYLWGNRTASTDPDFKFLSVSRTADVIDISIAKAHRWAVDRAITKTYFDDVSSSVRAFLRYTKTRGGLLGGDCWYDEEFNQPEDVANGNATFDYDFTPPFPAERVTFRSHLTSEYVRNIFAN